MKVLTAQAVWSMNDEDRERILRWLRTHGLDPNEIKEVRISQPFWRLRRTAYVVRYKRNAKGSRYLDPWTKEAATDCVKVRLRPLGYSVPHGS